VAEAHDLLWSDADLEVSLLAEPPSFVRQLELAGGFDREGEVRFREVAHPPPALRELQQRVSLLAPAR
jgi:hypothetical protein